MREGLALALCVVLLGCAPSDAVPHPARPAAHAAAPTEPAPRAAAIDFTRPSRGELPAIGDVELLPFDRGAYTGACPSVLGAAGVGSVPNGGWSCHTYEGGIMHMCVGTEEAVASSGDLMTYARTALDGMGQHGIQMVERRDVILNGEPAVRLVYDNPSTPGRFVSYLFARGGQGYTMSCAAAPADTFEAMLPTYEAALQSVRFH